MTIDPKKSGASPSAPTWGNWSGNIVHEPPTNGANYYFRPTNLVELKSVLADAVTKGVTVRVSGQRHSQPPLVINDNRGGVLPLPTTYLVDMSCYADLGPGSKDLMVLGPGPNQVTLNPGTREDDLDAFLTQHNLMLDTVTATQWGNFHIAAPMEFRFVKGGDSAMSGAFSKNGDAYFVNLDLISFVEPSKSSEYPAELLKFFAHVERKWVSLGGLPHNGKMFGFYDPTDQALDSYTPPFNKKFLSFITKQRIEARQAPVDAFEKYRKTCDPNGLFYAQFLCDLLEG
jgi:FAD/FMN-containing dehydrogenase